MATRWAIRRISDGKFLSNYRHQPVFGELQYARLFTRKNHAAPKLSELGDKVELVQFELVVKWG